MMPASRDTFTEPTDVDSGTLANLGPLRRLAGRWRARRGVDFAPKPPGPERRVFIENRDFQANGPQLFHGPRYHIHITLSFHADGSWSYVSDTALMVEGHDAPFAHQARNPPHRIGDAHPQSLGGDPVPAEGGVMAAPHTEPAFANLGNLAAPQPVCEWEEA